MYDKPRVDEANAPMLSEIDQPNQPNVPPVGGYQIPSNYQMAGQPPILNQQQGYYQPQEQGNLNPQMQGQYYYQPQTQGQPLCTNQTQIVQYSQTPIIIQPIIEIPVDSQDRRVKLKYLYPQYGLLLVFLNIFFPGWGTMICGSIFKPKEACYYIFIGLLQFFLCFAILGFIFAQISTCVLYSYWNTAYYDP